MGTISAHSFDLIINDSTVATVNTSNQILHSSGTPALPSFSMISDTNTGIYSVGADELGISTGGSLRFSVNSTGYLNGNAVTGTAGILGTGAGTATAPTYSYFGDSDSGSYRIGANNTALALGGVKSWDYTAALAQMSQAAANTTLQVLESSDSGNGPNLLLSRSRGSSLTVPTAIQSANNIATVNFQAYGTSSYGIGSSITAVATENWSDTAHGTYLSFATVASTTTTLSEKVRIENNGQLMISAGTASLPALTFVSDPNTGIYNISADKIGFSTGGTLGLTLDSSQNLITVGDVYQVAWTDYSGSSTIVGFSSTTISVIRYKKIGRLVFVSFSFSGTSNSTSLTFTVPYTAANTTVEFGGCCSSSTDNGTGKTAPAKCVLAANSTTVNCYLNFTTGAWTASGTKAIAGEFWFEATT